MKKPKEVIQTSKTITEVRGSTHGNWLEQSSASQRLKRILRTSVNFENNNLTDSQLDALEMICVKISRILTGNPNEHDHWLDIQGYAELGKSGHGTT